MRHPVNDQTEASPNPDDETKDEAAEQIPDEAADRPEASEPASSESDTDPSADEDLPEWEPLTPELVEDEAIRGDFHAEMGRDPACVADGLDGHSGLSRPDSYQVG